MISRVAEHCFWMSRYLERAENTARVLDVNQTLLLDFDVPIEQQWMPLLIITGCHFDEAWKDKSAAADGERVQEYMTWERSNLAGIASCIAAARENARIIREVISIEMWERLNYFYLWVQSPAAKTLYDQSRGEFYKQIKEINQAFHGITDGTMSHGQAWDFMQLGKFIERACQTARIVDVKYHILLPDPESVGTPVDAAQWTAVLKSCSAYEPFHKQRRMVGGDLGVAVAEFLIFDGIFPRSVRRCLSECRTAAHAISGRPESRPENDVEKRLDSLISWLHLSNVDDFVKFGLHDSLTSVINRIHELGDSMHHTYFDVKFEMPRIVSAELKPQVAVK